MAENIIWYANHVFKGKKIIIWAANAHIAKQPHSNRPNDYYMGHQLHQYFGADYYALAFYGYEGKFFFRPNNKLGNFYPTPKKGSIEDLLSYSNHADLWINFATDDDCFEQKINEARGNEIIPNEFYDAVIFFRKINPVVYEE